MNSLFGTTAAIEEAALTTKNKSLFKTTLSFLLVFLVGSMLSGFILTIPMYYCVFTDEAVTELITSGETDPDVIMETVEAVSASLPDWLNIVSLFATFATIIASIYYCLKIENRSLFTMGFCKKGALKEYVIGLIIGLLMFSIAFGIILFSGHAEFIGFNSNVSIGLVILFLLGFIIQGMSEEVLLRGLYFVSGANSSNIAISIFASSAFFAALHLSNPGVSILAILNLFLFGVFAALYFLRRGSIWGIGAVHTIWNFAQGNIYGCKVSGAVLNSSLFESAYVGNSTLFNGGDFGPEGGLGVTIVLFTGIVVLLFMKNKRVEPEYKIKNEFQSA